MKKRNEVNHDGLLVSVIQHSMEAIQHEMTTTIERTAQWFLIAQCRDISTGIYDNKGNLLSQGEGLPCHSAGNDFMVKAVLKRWGEDIHPGDMFAQNDPYYLDMGAGGHLPDTTFVSPIFYKDELVFFAMTRGHLMDTGGALPTGYHPGLYDIHSEGIKLNAVRFYHKGKPTNEYDFFINQIRWADDQRLDFEALRAALVVCAKRMGELCDRYGKDTILACLNELVRRGENSMRAEIKKFPEGVYYGEQAIDRDGTTDERLWVKCDITIRHGPAEMIVDFSKSSSCENVGLINSPLAGTYAAVFIGIFTSIYSTILHNAGTYKPVRIIAPKGTIVNPKYPCTVGAAAVTCEDQITAAVHNALGKALPKQVPAQWGPAWYTFCWGKRDCRTGQPFAAWFFEGCGGAGADWGHDGWPAIAATCCLAMDVRGMAEITELRWPLRTVRHELWKDSGGEGRWRGGLGVIFEAQNLNKEPVGIHFGGCDGDTYAPYGVAGGKDGILSRGYILSGDKIIDHKTKDTFTLLPGEIVHIESSGGGGAGDPFERDIEAVREDVMNEFVSAEKAREQYGVVIDSTTFEIDYEATECLRRKHAPQ